MYSNFSQFSSFPYANYYGGYPNQTAPGNTNMFNREFQQNQPQVQQNTNITFVNGIEGAKAFQMSPNSSVLMMDSDNQKFYVKTTDNLGVAKITSYSFSEDTVSQSNKGKDSAEAANIVQLTADEYNDILQNLVDLKKFKADVEDKLKDIL